MKLALEKADAISIWNIALHVYKGLHMGPNNVCYVTRHFLFFSRLCRNVTFDKSLTSLSIASVVFFIKVHVGMILQLLKWPCRTSFFTHVEPYMSKMYMYI